VGRAISKLLNFIRKCFAASTPIWIANDPSAPTCFEFLSTSPIIIATVRSATLPLGAASLIGSILRNRPVHYLVMLSWTIESPESSAWLARVSNSYLNDHPKHDLIFLCNTHREAELLNARGCAAVVINRNCFVDERVFQPIPEVEQIYDAVYNARLLPFKRHELALEIKKLALIYFHSHGDSAVDFHNTHAQFQAMMPTAQFVNQLTAYGCQRISGREVNHVLAQSRVGLCLSKREGQMRASIEYLLAGLSVVSTPNLGGRDYFFDDEFCVIVNPDPRSIRDAVNALIDRNVPRDYVRSKTLARVENERSRYINVVQNLIDRSGGTMRFAECFWDGPRGQSLIEWRSTQELYAKATQLST
jgi:glycosyltransferase involved in cell wall biosynthesis